MVQNVLQIVRKDSSRYNNLALQYQGFLGSAKRGQTLGNYQEARIRQFHQTLDTYLAQE